MGTLELGGDIANTLTGPVRADTVVAAGFLAQKDRVFTLLDEIDEDVQFANFFAGADGNRGGVRLGMMDYDFDRKADLVTGSGEGEASKVRIYLSPKLTGGASPSPDHEVDPFGGAVLANGVFVG